MEAQRPLYGDARRYDRRLGTFFRGLHRQASRLACKAAPEGGSVLDVGCGPGTLARMTARRRGDLTVRGVDPSAQMIRYAQERTGPQLRARVEFARAGAERLPYPDESFDVVVSTMSFQHWQPLGDAVTEVLRVTRPSGRVLLYNVRGAAYEPLRAAAKAAGWSGTGRTVRVAARPLLMFTHIELSRP
ncbi:MAG TPA: class I SAM-dependent methyltransferase [Streptomyces sp.]|nr:class I SAM-dependent methyltransferase [Streptomyces sp.]